MTTATTIAAGLDFEELAPGAFRAVAQLDHAVTKQLDAAGIDHRLRELVRIRASQLNGCAYCIDMHTKDARAVGETEQRLYALAAWRETPFFTDRERAALASPRQSPGSRDARARCRLRGGGRPASPTGGRGAARPILAHQRVEDARRHDPGVGAGPTSDDGIWLQDSDDGEAA